MSYIVLNNYEKCIYFQLDKRKGCKSRYSS